MLYSSLENTADSIVPRRHVRSCIEFKCLPASPLDGKSTVAKLVEALERSIPEGTQNAERNKKKPGSPHVNYSAGRKYEEER